MTGQIKGRRILVNGINPEEQKFYTMILELALMDAQLLRALAKHDVKTQVKCFEEYQEFFFRTTACFRDNTLSPVHAKRLIDMVDEICDYIIEQDKEDAPDYDTDTQSFSVPFSEPDDTPFM